MNLNFPQSPKPRNARPLLMILLLIITATVSGLQAQDPHPRLFFTSKNIPQLRQKAATPEGKAILKQLRVLLGNGGETMPTEFNTRESVNILKGGDESLASTPLGTFTLSHCTGYALLYTLTNDKKYAELSRQAVQALFDGKLDRDERYSWVKPGTGFRGGAVFMALAMSYDMCRDAWPQDFRETFVKNVMDYAAIPIQHPERELTLEQLAAGNGYPAGSNHHGAALGGAGLMALVLMDEPGADNARLEKVLKTAQANAAKLLSGSFGPKGWFAEGTHPGRISANSGLVPFLQALRHTGRADLIGKNSSSKWLALRWAFELRPSDKGPLVHARGPYGEDLLYERSPMLTHSGGEFCQGFGILDDREKAVLLWSYLNAVEPDGAVLFDARAYPHHAVFAFINWPVGMQPVNPGEVLPHALHDSTHEWFAFRKEWKDGEDILVSAYAFSGPRGFHKKSKDYSRHIKVSGLGMQVMLPRLLIESKTQHWSAYQDGSACFTIKDKEQKSQAYAVDFSGASGAALLMAAVGAEPWQESMSVDGKSLACHTLDAAGTPIQILLLGNDPLPTPAVNGNKVTVGKQAVSFDGTNLALGTAAKAAVANP